MKTLEVAGESYDKRLRDQLKRECAAWSVPMPTDEQIGAVLHAMADHTSIMAMTRYDRSNLYHPERGDDLWPTETSVGRFFHTAGDLFRSRG